MTRSNRTSWRGLREAMVPRDGDEKLGAFIGVFTPSILTTLGVILYLRTGWVVGNVGLVPALTIVIIANAVTLVTALSVSAVATNMRVGSGGAYHIISRSLGIEVGSTIRELIWERSVDADVVFLGLRSNEPGEEAAYAERVLTMLSRLPSVLMIRNAGEFRGQLLGDVTEEESASHS